MFKNVASQKVRFYAFIPSTGLPKTGDAANLTAYVSKDWGTLTALTDTSATEVDATNAKGVYTFDLAQAETNADVLDFSCKSSTSDVALVPLLGVQTVPNRFTSLAIDVSGAAEANVTKFGSTAGTFTAGRPEVNATHFAGTAYATALTAEVTAHWAQIIEGSYTALQMMRLSAATLGAKASGLNTSTAVFRDLGDTKNRVTATVDADGNRSAVTLDLT